MIPDISFTPRHCTANIDRSHLSTSGKCFAFQGALERRGLTKDTVRDLYIQASQIAQPALSENIESEIFPKDFLR